MIMYNQNNQNNPKCRTVGKRLALTVPEPRDILREAKCFFSPVVNRVKDWKLSQFSSPQGAIRPNCDRLIGAPRRVPRDVGSSVNGLCLKLAPGAV
jgi:hypothetical protein